MLIQIEILTEKARKHLIERRNKLFEPMMAEIASVISAYLARLLEPGPRFTDPICPICDGDDRIIESKIVSDPSRSDPDPGVHGMPDEHR